MWKYRKVLPLVCWVIWFMTVLQTEAFYEEIPNVSMSADQNAFTTHAGEKDGEWYEIGTEVSTGVSGDLREPESWEHFYDKVCQGDVPVERWVVNWSEAKCIHKEYPSGNMVYGESFNRKYCKTPYYSGWIAYCADCKEPLIHNYVYMSKETAQKFTYMDLDKAYYYLCPHCNNLEMAIQYEKHVCKDISVNRYFVRYHANFGVGYMEKSVHMVNNATIYEGREITPQTTLNLNIYTRKGYEFAGWNTKQDGSGEQFADGAEIYNLSQVQNDSVILYAQWRKSKSVLEIDPAGGIYDGETSVFVKEGEYSSEYLIALEKLQAPTGYTVHFDTQGGEAIADRTGLKTFAEWSRSYPFYGELSGNIYLFCGPDRSVDRITAVYEACPILLPDAKKEGYSFGGWYEDVECSKPVGRPGDKYIPNKEVTLYADWVDLVLESEDNYTANQGKGAVNLTWNQEDEFEKVYMVYQKTEASEWSQIEETQEKEQGLLVSKTISFTGEEGEYTVPYTGFYNLTLTGAQGGAYKEYAGGKGGMVQATVYLERGEKLVYTIGGQDGYPDGGKGKPYAGGGGSSVVSSKKQGILFIAGGGGGASHCGVGGAGGSTKQLVSVAEGQSGGAGGGGGLLGGAAGKEEVHLHTGECSHVHVGTPTVYGGCYTKAAVCGSTEILKKEDRRVFYYGNIADDGSRQFCERCGSDTCPGHLDIFYKYVCVTCNYSSTTAITSCPAKTAYEPGCGLSNSYTCGMEEGQLLSVQPAYGGSSYVNEEACIQYSMEEGMQCGNGELVIASVQIGVIEKNELPGVIATDMEPPEAIEEGSIVKTAIAEDAIRIAFAKPKDNGTAYYHMVESYNRVTDELLCTSNQTRNVLTSGVVGYRYVVNEKAGTVVNQQHTYLAEEGDNPFLVVDVTTQDTYLHIAAVDKAGNIGQTIHILVSAQDNIYWPLLTEMLQIEEGSHIYPAEQEKTYYVKADDSTPIAVTLEGLLCGTARKNYQINLAGYQILNCSNDAQAGRLNIMVPVRDSIVSGLYTYPMSSLQKRQEGFYGLQDAGYTMVKRYNMCKSILAVQKFTISKTLDGQRFQVTPRVAVIGERESVWSQEENDLLHSICLIADGIGPDITGMEVLEELETVDLEDGEVLEMELCAKDSGSGLAEFYVEVRNLENGMIVRYTDEDLCGRIALTISEEEEVFHGVFAIGAYAVDRVGNETAIQNNLLNIGLSAYIERVLVPHTPIFKRGESGVLHVETIGYVERVEITFPPAFTVEDASLNRVFVYENPEYLQKEEISFMVPFTVPEGEMTVMVKAYKAGSELEKEPELLTITVKGSILDELRTRLR